MFQFSKIMVGASKPSQQHLGLQCYIFQIAQANFNTEIDVYYNT